MNVLGRRLGLLIACGLAIAAPIPFGATSSVAVAGLAIAVAIGLLAVWRDRETTAAVPAWLFCLLIVSAGLPWLYLVPLPAAWVDHLSPRLASEAQLALASPNADPALASTERELFQLVNSVRSETAYRPLAVDWDGALNGALRYTLIASCFLLAWMTASTTSSRRVVAAALGVSAFGQAAYGLAESLSHHHQILGVPKIHYLPLPSGTFVCPNHWAALLSLGLFAVIGLIVGSSRHEHEGTGDGASHWARMALSGTAMAVIGIALLWSSSRAALAALGTGLLVFLLALVWRRSRNQSGPDPARRLNTALLFTALLAVASLVGAVMMRPPVPLEDDLARVGHDFSGRSAIWSTAWEARAAFSPLGSGIGTYPTVQALFRPRSQPVQASHAHNDYLESSVELGWLGVLLPLTWIVTIALGSFRLFARARDRALTAAFATALLALALHESVDFSLQLAGVAVPAALLAGALLAPLPWGPSAAATSEAGGRGWLALALAVMAAAGALLSMAAPRSGPLTSPDAARTYSQFVIGDLAARLQRNEVPSSDQTQDSVRSAWLAARNAFDRAPLRAEGALAVWFAAQAVAASRGVDEPLPQGFENYSAHLLEQAERLDRADRQRRLTIARLWLASGDNTRAARLVKDVLTDSPDRAEQAYTILGGASLELADLMAATPNLPQPAMALIRHLQRRQDRSGAAIVIERAYSQHSDFWPLRLNFAVLQRDRGRRDEAVRTLESGQAPSDPVSRKSWFGVLAQVAADAKQFAVAERALTELERLGEDRRSLALQRARVAVGAGQPAQAIELLRAVLQDRDIDWPESSVQLQALLLMGQLLATSGDYSTALPYYRDAQRIDPQNAQARAFLEMLSQVK